MKRCRRLDRTGIKDIFCRSGKTGAYEKIFKQFVKLVTVCSLIKPYALTLLPVEEETFGTRCDLTPPSLCGNHRDVQEVSLQLPVSWRRIPAAETQVF